MEQTAQYIQIFYEIAMSIGKSLQIKPMLHDALIVYLRKLNLSGCAVIRMQRFQSHMLIRHLQYTFPTIPERNTNLMKAIDTIPRIMRREVCDRFLHKTPLIVRGEDGHTSYIMELPDFGFVILVKGSGELNEYVVNSLKPINEKLARACTGCLQNDELRHTISELSKTENRHRAIFENTTDIYFKIDRSGFIAEISPSIQYYSDYKRSQLMGEHAAALFLEDDHYKSFLERVRTSGQLKDYELDMRGKGGKTMTVMINTHLLWDQMEEYDGLEGTLREVTRRKQLSQDVSLLRKALEASTDAVIITDAKANFLWFNSAFCDLTGYGPDELKGQNFRLLKSGAHSKSFYRKLWKGVLSGQPWKGVLSNKRKDGSIYTDQMSIAPVRSESGEITHFIVVKRDITEEEHRNLQIKSYSESLRATVNSLNDCLITIDSGEVISSVYLPRSTGLHKYITKKDVNKKLASVFPEPVYAQFHSALLNFEPATEFFQFDFPCVFPGSDDWYNATITPRKLSDKADSGYTIVIKNITDAKKLELLLKEISEQKSNFVASVSHELRTPLTAIMGFSSSIMTDKELPEEMKEEFIGIIHEESLRLSRLIEDVLSISRIESGTIQINPEKHDLRLVLGQSCQTNQLNADNKNITLSVEMPEEFPTLLIDSDSMRQVCDNLINNAIKFTPEGGRVDVMLTAGAEEVQISVKDTGIGIPENLREKIFTKFYRVHTPGLSIPGTGLGLAIVREIVDLHEGKITVTSAENSGTTFTITLPRYKELQINGTDG
jgi:PAS domain S-box-containing protein